MTPLERAARALARLRCPPGGEAQFPYVSAAEWEENNWRNHLYAARAILLALREPSEGMIEVGSYRGSWDYYADGKENALDVYKAMIDKALEEG